MLFDLIRGRFSTHFPVIVHRPNYRAESEPYKADFFRWKTSTTGLTCVSWSTSKPGFLVNFKDLQALNSWHPESWWDTPTGFGNQTRQFRDYLLIGEFGSSRLLSIDFHPYSVVLASVHIRRFFTLDSFPLITSSLSSRDSRTDWVWFMRAPGTRRRRGASIWYSLLHFSSHDTWVEIVIPSCIVFSQLRHLAVSSLHSFRFPSWHYAVSMPASVLRFSFTVLLEQGNSIQSLRSSLSPIWIGFSFLQSEENWGGITLTTASIKIRGEFALFSDFTSLTLALGTPRSRGHAPWALRLRD